MIADGSHALIEQFRKVDMELAPVGLYAAGTEVFDSKVLFPILKQDGGRIIGYLRPRLLRFTDANGRDGLLELLTFSAVKVRRFGNRFAADARIDYHDRRNARRIQKKLCDLWSEENGMRRMLAIVGFDRSDNPFRPEFEQLARDVNWVSRGVTCTKAAWRDPHGRDFSCVVFVWERS